MLGTVTDNPRDASVTENEFIRSIDCRFPYHDRVRARELIEASLAISANAVFTIVHELVLPGHSVQVAPTVLLELLSELEARFEHPLKALVFAVARRMIRDEPLSQQEVLQAISQVAEHPGEYQALNVISSSGEPDDGIENADEKVRAQWQKVSPQ